MGVICIEAFEADEIPQEEEEEGPGQSPEEPPHFKVPVGWGHSSVAESACMRRPWV